MRFRCLLLVCCLLQAQQAHAIELFGDFLYWQANEPVDWVLDTNSNPANQYVTYKTTVFNFAPGFRVGVGQQGEWDTKVYYTHYHSSAADSASGDLTAAFLGGKLSQPPAPSFYYDTGQMNAAIDYNIFDWDIGKHYNPTESLLVRPIVGLRGGWINQSFNTAFQAAYPVLGIPVTETVTENMKSNFWGVGPKIGIENVWNVWRGEELEINCTANFFTAYLLGHWQIRDVTNTTTTVLGLPLNSTTTVPIPNRDFGALAFQVVLGFNLKFRGWSTTVGYEINDWLNQCQIFDDATGPHNNDLILQGLTLKVDYGF
jgi:hypothetical protein